MIPLALHFVWTNDDTPSVKAQAAIDSWTEHAPQFAATVWTRSAIIARWGAQMFATDLTPAVLSDLLRVHIVNELGGVYLDADIFACAGAGAKLADVCSRCKLFGTSFDKQQSLGVDTVPMGAVAGLPDFFKLARRPDQFIGKWNRYLATSAEPPIILPGCFWNANEPGEGVYAEHRRGSLRVDQPRPPSRRPERPTLVIRGKSAAAAHAEKLQRSKVTPSAIANREALIGQIPDLPGAKLAVEVGTDRGRFAEKIAQGFAGELVCVDPYIATVDDIADPHTNTDRETDFVAATTRLAQFGDRVRIVRKKSADAVSDFADGSLDFVYLDGDHYRPGIDGDLEAWWPKVKPGGVLAGHDLTGEWEPWIRPAVEEFAFWKQVTPMATLDFPASWFFVKR